nr:importin-13 [Pelodiscus sinensis]|eukprot:XP_025043148.1 importin-13 [Pelodiscus sinensis]
MLQSLRRLNKDRWKRTRSEYKALHQLYYDPNIENKNLAQKWLMQAQVSPQAWHFSWLLLNLDKVPEIQYFGASALHIKISRYWNDIPADQYESLKSQLFSQITRFASGSKIVLTRLCVALASLALSMMPEAWYVNTLLKLIGPVLGLQEQLRQAVQAGDMETSHGICRIAVALGENHSR